MTHGTGRLVLVATPIGNLEDLSARAARSLAEADVIACEDTRHSQKLLNHAGISGPRLIAVHEHNENEAAARIVNLIEDGSVVVLITDAGMPGISDPGQRVVAAVAAQLLPVSVVPGPSAVPAALAVSGLDTTRFCFEGFLPRKGAQRGQRIASIAQEQRTTVLYEAANRLLSTVAELIRACGPQRQIALVRELTKVHEEVWRGSLEGLSDRLQEAPVRGECVLVIAGAAPVFVEDAVILKTLHECLKSGATRKEAIAATAKSLAVARNRVYELATESNPNVS